MALLGICPEIKRPEGRANTLAARLGRICKPKAPAAVSHAASVHQGEAKCGFVH
jgi:hypothetical protein